MSNRSPRPARVLLKARPTAEQLADRAAVRPDGLELYLDVADISGEGWLDAIERRVAGLDLPAGFVWIVEGPLRSLDGSFFDVSRPSEANREVVRRIAACGRALGAEAAVIHAIALAEPGAPFGDDIAAATLEASLPLVRCYAETCREAGLTPTIENVPPMLKMREGRLLHSLLGMEPDDLLALCGAIAGLRATLDVSHAQLYLNAANAEPAEVPAEVAPVVAFLRRRRTVRTLAEYIDRVQDLIFEAHISNARGLFGEGLAYDDGELDLNAAAARLGHLARYLVTETIEADPNDAILMRACRECLLRAVAPAKVGG